MPDLILKPWPMSRPLQPRFQVLSLAELSKEGWEEGVDGTTCGLVSGTPTSHAFARSCRWVGRWVVGRGSVVEFGPLVR